MPDKKTDLFWAILAPTLPLRLVNNGARGVIGDLDAQHGEQVEAVTFSRHPDPASKQASRPPRCIQSPDAAIVTG